MYTYKVLFRFHGHIVPIDIIADSMREATESLPSLAIPLSIVRSRNHEAD